MMSLIICLGVVLVFVILYMIFRIGNLVVLMKGSESKVDSFNKVNAALFMVFSVTSIGGFLWYSFAHYKSYVLPVASIHGKITDDLFWLTMWITVVAFIIISIAMFWFTYKYQHREGQKAAFFTDSHKLEIIWTIVPAIVLALLIFRGLRDWNDITGPASPKAEVIELVAQQFAWTARYPGVKDNELGSINYMLIDASNEFGLDLRDKNTFDDFKSLELHLPAGKEVLLKIRAKDVLHSVYLPHFRVKMDAVPGMMTVFKFTPTVTTAEMRKQLNNPKFNYEMACAEICGKGHFSMRFPVIVDTQEDYDKWKAAQDSWLKQNPDYLKRVPAELREAAMIKAGLPLDNTAAGASVRTVSVSN
jgi:cytochrome c oxidase subunit II